MSDYAELCSDHKCGNCQRCINARLRAERDDYEQAWRRDLEKGLGFLAERNALAARLHIAQELLEEIFDKKHTLYEWEAVLARVDQFRAIAEPGTVQTGAFAGRVARHLEDIPDTDAPAARIRALATRTGGER